MTADPRIAEVARMLWLDGFECGALDPDETREAAAKFSDVARRIIEWIDRHPPGWRPMNTLPPRTYVLISKWVEGECLWVDRDAWYPQEDDPEHRGVWRERADDGFRNHGPTHWMPDRDPPQDNGGDGYIAARDCE